MSGETERVLVPRWAVLALTGPATIQERGQAENVLKAALDNASPAEPVAVYIAEAIWFGENPVDGRSRIAVRASLDDALDVLRRHDIYGADLVATETTSALGTDDARTWAVHERGEEPDDEGHLWITEEPTTGSAKANEGDHG